MTRKQTNNHETSISEIDSNQKKYYTAEEAIEFLEPRIRDLAIRDGETGTRKLNWKPEIQMLKSMLKSRCKKLHLNWRVLSKEIKRFFI